MTEAEKAYQYFVIAVPENEEQAKAYFWARKVLQPTLTPPNEWVSRLRELDELYTKLHAVTGFTAEQLLEMFAAGYTLEKHDYSKSFEEMVSLLEYEKEHANAYYEECGQWEAENTQLKEKLEALKQDRDAIEQDFRAFAKQWWEEDSGFPCRWCKFERQGGCEWKVKHPGEICAGRAFEWRGQREDCPGCGEPLSQAPNEPLTLEQLREMDGEPAYIPENDCWVLVTQNPYGPLFTWPGGEQCSAYDWYEQVGAVYRRVPEGE